MFNDSLTYRREWDEIPQAVKERLGLSVILADKQGNLEMLQDIEYQLECFLKMWDCEKIYKNTTETRPILLSKKHKYSKIKKYEVL